MIIHKRILFLESLVILISSCKKEAHSKVAPVNTIDTSKIENPIYSAKTYNQKAYFVYNLISKYYSVPVTDFFLENYPKGTGDRLVAYMWYYSGVVTGIGMLRQLDYQYTSFNKVDRGIDKYWSNINNLAGVKSYPPSYGGGTRFYDDNAIIGLDYLENYQATQNQHYLDQAIKCMDFDFTGESNDCDGGIFWNENERTPGTSNYIKATCSSAFSNTLALKLYQITSQSKYLDFAKRMYGWIKLKLQDPADLIYWNDVAIANCTTNKTKWDYNSGAMLSNAVLLYKETGDQQYLNDAKQLASATFNYFTVSSDKVGRQFPDHDPWFTTVLFRGYPAFYEIDPDKNTGFIKAMIKNVDYAWLNARNYLGFFSKIGTLQS